MVASRRPRFCGLFFPLTLRLKAQAGVAAAAILLAASPAVCAEPDVAISPARQQELVRLVRQDCGACHGLSLRGGLGPPLTPQALRDRPAESLVATVLNGRPGTPMPPWRLFLSEAEAQWIVDALTKGFPNESPARPPGG
jgi:cytochrome c55X